MGRTMPCAGKFQNLESQTMVTVVAVMTKMKMTMKIQVTVAEVMTKMTMKIQVTVAEVMTKMTMRAVVRMIATFSSKAEGTKDVTGLDKLKRELKDSVPRCPKARKFLNPAQRPVAPVQTMMKTKMTVVRMIATFSSKAGRTKDVTGLEKLQRELKDSA